ncbi:MAG: redoxin domain-containing protein [Patescibacteria group bacterium]
MPKIGQAFPDFNLDTYHPHDSSRKDVNLAAFKGKWLVVFFYPADFTYVCPTELRDLARNYVDIQALGAEVLAVSTDTVYTHKAWVETETLLKDVRYPLAADHAGLLARTLGILNEVSGIADRGVYIIDPEGLLQSAEVVAENIGRSASEIVRKLRALTYVRNNPGHACPVSWDTNGKDLVPDLKIAGKVAQALGE